MSRKVATRVQRRRHEEAAAWLLRNRESGRSAADKAAFQAWLDADPEHCRVYQAAELMLGDARSAIESDPDLRDFKTKPRSLAKPVAGALVTLGLAGCLFVAMDGPIWLEADLMSGVGELPIVTLSDGSVVQLNASSAIAYDYSDSRRGLRLLRGEAFFQVAHDASRPFVVEAGGARVTALGTAFDVRVSATQTDVAVTENAIMFDFANQAHEKVRVEQGERAAYDSESGVSEVTASDSLLALAWRRGQLAVENVPLSYVVEEMNRHFSGRIVISSREIARRRVSGTMKISDVDAALTFLQHAIGVKASRIGPLIVIRG